MVVAVEVLLASPSLLSGPCVLRVGRGLAALPALLPLIAPRFRRRGPGAAIDAVGERNGEPGPGGRTGGDGCGRGGG